jgi:tRNA1Val (adenine37-N6)-methyltransferase
MANNYFSFKQFTIKQEKAAFRVGTDGVLLGACAELTGASSVLDIGTGTGLVAIMCAQRSETSVTAIEPDHDSYVEAAENVKLCPWTGRISVIESDLRSYSKGSDRRFDTIVSNPPYFRDSLLNPDHIKSSTRHSFSLSSDDLLGGTDTLMSSDGSLQLILPFEEGSLFIAEAALKGFFCNSIIRVKPFPEGKIIRLIMKFERVKKTTREKFLTIETGSRHSYTEEYKELTKDFYLKF